MSDERRELFGLLAEFSDPDELISACSKVRETGYHRLDAFSPTPIHGLA